MSAVFPDVFSLQELRDTITAQDAALCGSATPELATVPEPSHYVPTPAIDFYVRLYVVNVCSSNLLPEMDSRDIHKASMQLKMAGLEMPSNPLKDLDISCMLALSLVKRKAMWRLCIWR